MGGSCFSQRFKSSSQAVMPSSWGMFVYSEETLRVTKRLPEGNWGNLRNLFVKSVVSCICDGSWVMLGRRKNWQSVKCFPSGTIGSNDGSPRVPRLVYFRGKVQFHCSWMLGEQEVPYVFVYQLSFIHRVDTFFNLCRILRCWVCRKLRIVYRLVLLSVGFLDVIFFAQHDYSGSFVCWLYYYVGALSEVFWANLSSGGRLSLHLFACKWVI